MATAKRSTKKPNKWPSAETRLSSSELRWRCDPDSLPFDSTDDVNPSNGVVGQDAAVEALRFGLHTTAPGQHIFVRGLHGTGRLTLVRRLLEEIRTTCPLTKDCCYAHNFYRPECPRLITLPAGKGQDFRRRIDRLADFIRDDLGTALSSEGINARRRVMDQTAQTRIDELLQPTQDALNEANLTLVSVEAGPVVQAVIFPLVDEKAVAPEEFDQLHAQGAVKDQLYQSTREKMQQFDGQIKDINDAAHRIRREHDDEVAALLERSARSVLDKVVEDILATYAQESVKAFIVGILDDVVKHHLGDVTSYDQESDFTRRYRINVVSEHIAGGECPTMIENTPTTRNLVGTIDYDFGGDPEGGPSHMGIRAGSLLRADGGFLILEDRDVLGEPDAWKALVRCLRTGKLEITPTGAAFPGWAPSLKPEPIDISVKVVMLGDPETYAMLDANDPNFPQLFKVLADFDSVIPRDEAGVRHYASVLARIVKEDKLPPFEREAMMALIEQGARIADEGGKLSARFGRIADIAREAAFVAQEESKKTVSGADVREALLRGRLRADLPSRRFRELLVGRTIRIDTVGDVVGQVNGLATMQAGPMIYGFPARITATIGPGTAGVINIEGEADLSGAIHTKGFYILGGLLRHLLRTDHPLAFDASVAFEQSYGGIDGDSASCAEICCLISALTDIPIRQGIAMTGAIDQVGHILAIGAVNEKVEGFFAVCREMGLTGAQGVVIPKANALDLMLAEEVIHACNQNLFHIYAVETVHQALEVLTGRAAGVRNARGTFPKGSVLGEAVTRAKDYWMKAATPASRLAGSTRRRRNGRA